LKDEGSKRLFPESRRGNYVIDLFLVVPMYGEQIFTHP
jgi:hypothetical protein